MSFVEGNSGSLEKAQHAIQSHALFRVIMLLFPITLDDEIPLYLQGIHVHRNTDTIQMNIHRMRIRISSPI